MTEDQHEIEDTYAVDAGARPPDFERLDGVDSMRDDGVLQLEATYFDTAELTLVAAGISLRRRTGGTDAGWHLKLPMKKGRLEVHEPLSRATRTVPKSLRTLLVAHTRGATLRPVVVLRTERHVHRLLDEEGTILAEFCDDRVSAEIPGESEPTTWREWELELVEADSDLLEAAAGLVEESGGRPAPGTKLGTALGERVPVKPQVVLPRPTRKGPASAVVQLRLREQVDVIRSYDPLARHDAPDAVHKMRVAVRRLRNALASYRPVLVREQTEPVRDELKWLAAALGEPRDAEVMRERLELMLADESPEVIRGAGYAADGRGDARAVRSGPLTHGGGDGAPSGTSPCSTASTSWRPIPRGRRRPRSPSHTVLRKRMRHDYKRLVGRVEHADEAQDEEREHRLHEARKAAKRVRYAAEALTGVYGKPAKRFVNAMKRVQSRLGDHHDAFVTQNRLRELGDEAASTGDNAFVFGTLHAREEDALVEADDQFVAEWGKASRKRRRRWMSS